MNTRLVCAVLALLAARRVLAQQPAFEHFIGCYSLVMGEWDRRMTAEELSRYIR
jgi:hypothetical protein